VGYFYYSPNLNWATQNPRLGHGLDIAGLDISSIAMSTLLLNILYIPCISKPEMLVHLNLNTGYCNHELYILKSKVVLLLPRHVNRK